MIVIGLVGQRQRREVLAEPGGGPGEVGATWVERIDGSRQTLTYSEETEMQAGDVFVVATPSGGAFGAAV